MRVCSCVRVCLCVWPTPCFFSMWDLLGLQLIGDKVQGGRDGGIKDGVLLERERERERECVCVCVFVFVDRQIGRQTGRSRVVLIKETSPLSDVSVSQAVILVYWYHFLSHLKLKFNYVLYAVYSDPLVSTNGLILLLKIIFLCLQGSSYK